VQDIGQPLVDEGARGIANSSDTGHLFGFVKQTVADGSTDVLLPDFEDAQKIGEVRIRAGAEYAAFSLRGGIEEVQQIADVGGRFSDSQGTSSSTNVFHDGSDYVIENLRGSETTYEIYTFI
jgi:hypothetical protein